MAEVWRCVCAFPHVLLLTDVVAVSVTNACVLNYGVGNCEMVANCAVCTMRAVPRRALSSGAAAAHAGPKPRVLLLAGPTGVGKSRLAVDLARRLNGEIVRSRRVRAETLTLFCRFPQIPQRYVSIV